MIESEGKIRCRELKGLGRLDGGSYSTPELDLCA